jgi:hypothetical protein
VQQGLGQSHPAHPAPADEIHFIAEEKFLDGGDTLFGNSIVIGKKQLNLVA